MSFYTFKNNVQAGPFDEATLRAQISAGQLSAADLVIRAGETTWRPLGELLPDAFRAAAPPPPQAQQFQPQSQFQQQRAAGSISAPAPMNKKTAVGIYIFGALALLLGTLVAGLGLMLMADRVIKEQSAFAFFTVGILGYLLFVVIATVFNFYTLARMYGAIQDGVSTSTGKAIGFLFIPIFSIYWVFKVWGGYPTEYNSFLDRHGLKAPPVTSGVFAALPIVMLLTGLFVVPLLFIPIVFAKVIARTADAVNNMRLAIEYKNNGNTGPVPEWHTDETSRAEFRTWKLAGIAGAGLLGLLLVGFAGFVVWNMNPSVPAGVYPESAGKFKLQKMYAKRGSFFGITKTFSATYEPTEAGRKALIGYVNAYQERDASGWITDYCSGSGRVGEVKDAGGKSLGKYNLCDGELRYAIGNRLVKVGDMTRASLYEGGLPYRSELKDYKPVTDEELIEFARAVQKDPELAFEAGKSTGSSSTSSTTTTSPSSTSGITPASDAGPSATTPADFTISAEDFWTEAGTKSASKYTGKVVEITGHVDNSGTTISFRPQDNLIFINPDAASAAQTQALKSGDKATFKCKVSSGTASSALRPCTFVSSKKLSEVPAEITMTADQFYSRFDDYKKPTDSRLADAKKQGGKVFEISGTVKVKDGKAELAAGENTVECQPSSDAASEFSALKDGQTAKLRGIMWIYDLKHCIVVP